MRTFKPLTTDTLARRDRSGRTSLCPIVGTLVSKSRVWRRSRRPLRLAAHQVSLEAAPKAFSASRSFQAEGRPFPSWLPTRRLPFGEWRERLFIGQTERLLCSKTPFLSAQSPSVPLTCPAHQRKIRSTGRLHDGRTERKAESQDISGDALKHETAFGYGVSFGGERKLLRDARPNRSALEPRRSLGDRNFPGRTVGESTSRLL